ncbi:MAG: hypothetical protein U9N87_07260, partial [Planctomycetota bacterium]|nr:hypothetical protein [Planctomycetota bacterium]
FLPIVFLAIIILVSAAHGADRGARSKAAKPALVPVIELPWRRVAHNPELPEIGTKPGAVVDHCFFEAADGHWELWTQIRGTAKGRLFFRWEGTKQFDRADWTPRRICWRADPKYGESIGTAKDNDMIQAPFVYSENGKYTVYYGGGPRGDGPGHQICTATSDDGIKFVRTKDAQGRSRVFAGPGRSRDAMILKIGDRYFCYYCADENGKGVIALRTTKDLASGKWSDYSVASRGGILGTHNCSQQCPFVVYRHGWYYLFKMAYSNEYRTAVYASKDPAFFGHEDDSLVAMLPASAAEIIRVGEQDYISSLIPGYGGVRIARLNWAQRKIPFFQTKEKVAVE